ncbi:regulator of G-protein signaling 21-like [Labrus bergylta]|uniref:regulator of G-protein signaling 21-like n=1 Tax=Labrus bergylta TaxID=56723 RepID=UPI003313FCA1
MVVFYRQSKTLNTVTAPQRTGDVKMPKHLFSRIRFNEFKDLMQNVKRPRRIDIVLNRKRYKKDVQCLVVQRNYHDTSPSNVSWRTEHQLHSTLEKMLQDKKYLAAFRAFLQSEFSEENIEFWLACEDFRSTTSLDDLRWKAEKIYKEFIEPTACREINVDFHIKEKIKKSLEEPSLSCFDEAQRHVYLLMERDSWPRFLHSDAYLSLKHKSRTLWYI